MSEITEKRMKLVGIIFLVLAFFVSPLIWEQFRQHSFMFSMVFLVFGICYYLRVLTLAKAVKTIFEYFQQRNGWGILIGQMIIYVLYLLAHPNLLNYSLHAGQADEPSYTGFDFSSWVSVLGNHRTMGFYMIFGNFTLWPYFQVICFLLSVCYLYWCFLKFGFDRVMALLFVSFLLWDNPTLRRFLWVETEVFATIFMNLAVGSMFLAIKKWNWKTITSLVIFTFFLYQMRPNFSVIPLLIPFWAAGISVILQKFQWADVQRTALRFSLCTILPLMLFCLLRLLVVGQFGVVSMTGGSLAGHAAHYLNEDNIQLLSGDVRILADEILIRKRQFTPPNNMSPFDWIKILPEYKKIELQGDSFGGDLMNTWNVAIKQLKAIEPLDDPKKNIEAAKYVKTLAGFYSKNYTVEVDRLLMRFSIDVLSHEWQRYLHWLVGGTFYAMRIYLKSIAFWVCLLGILGIAKLLYLLFNSDLDSARLKRWHQEAGILFMVGASIFILGIFPIVAFSYPFARLLDLISIYLIPALFCCAFPPFWLTKKGIPNNGN